MVGRAGTTFPAYTSADGATWTPVAGSTISLPNLSGAILAGLAVTTHSGQVNTSVFAGVAIANSAPPPPGACPAGWTCTDIGNPPPGTQEESGGTWTVSNFGYDERCTADHLRYDDQHQPADGTVTT